MFITAITAVSVKRAERAGLRLLTTLPHVPFCQTRPRNRGHAGTAEIFAIFVVLAQLWRSYASSAQRFKLTGTALRVHACAIALILVGLLVPYLELSARLGAAAAESAAPLAPYEWTGEAVACWDSGGAAGVPPGVRDGAKGTPGRTRCPTFSSHYTAPLRQRRSSACSSHLICLYIAASCFPVFSVLVR